MMVYSLYAHRALDGVRVSTTNSQSLTPSVTRTFLSSVAELSIQVSNIVTDVTKASATLDSLEMTLSHIHGLCIRESLATTTAHDDLLWNIWAMLEGSYQRQLCDIQYWTATVKDIDHYRTLAAGYVAASMQTLVTIDVELSELRHRMEQGPLFGQEQIPMEVQLASIEVTLRRLKEELSAGKAGLLGRQG